MMTSGYDPQVGDLVEYLDHPWNSSGLIQGIVTEAGDAGRKIFQIDPTAGVSPTERLLICERGDIVRKL